jgi:hypothetical protein
MHVLEILVFVVVITGLFLTILLVAYVAFYVIASIILWLKNIIRPPSPDGPEIHLINNAHSDGDYYDFTQKL